MVEAAQVKDNFQKALHEQGFILDGTDDWVVLKFKNADGETCQTDYINRKSINSLYNPGSVVELEEELGDCKKKGREGFRPDDELKVQIVVWRKGKILK